MVGKLLGSYELMLYGWPGGKMGELMGRSMDWLVNCLVATYGADAWIYGWPGGKMSELMGTSMDWLVSCWVAMF